MVPLGTATARIRRSIPSETSRLIFWLTSSSSRTDPKQPARITNRELDNPICHALQALRRDDGYLTAMTHKVDRNLRQQNQSMPMAGAAEYPSLSRQRWLRPGSCQ